MTGVLEDTLTSSGSREAIIAIIISVIVGLAAIWSRRSARNAEQANKAVNGNPTTEPRLYERVVAVQDEQRNAQRERQVIAEKVDRLFEGQQEFQRRWGNLPPEMDDAVDLMSMFDRITDRLAKMEEGRVSHGRRLDRIEETLRNLTRRRGWR